MLKYYAVFALLISIYGHSNAQIAGPNSPSLAVASGTGATFANLTGMYANDNNAAYTDLAAYPTCPSSFLCYHSQEVVITGFGFSIPLNATITGVKVDIRKKVSQPVTTIHDSVVQLIINGQASGLNLSSANQWQMPFTYESYGDSINLWGNMLTAADVNSNQFGLKLMLSNGTIDQTAQVDHVQMTVYYNTASGISNVEETIDVAVFQDGNQLTIKAPDNKKMVRASVYDQSGRKIYTDTKGNCRFDLTGLKRGIYVIKIQFDWAVATRKVFIH